MEHELYENALLRILSPYAHHKWFLLHQAAAWLPDMITTKNDQFKKVRNWKINFILRYIKHGKMDTYNKDARDDII